MPTDILLLIARLLMAFMFFGSGMPKLLGSPTEREAIAQLGLPFPGALERLCGLFLIAASLMLALGLWAQWAAAGLAAFVLVVTPIFMRFWTADDPLQRAQTMHAFVGNVAIVGGLLAFVAVGPGGLSVTHLL